jgi:UDP-glucose 4-epimerase
MTRVLVTGATGFCGRPLVRLLVDSGFAVRGLSRRAPLPSIERVEFFSGDLAAEIEWAPILADVDAIVHLAAITAGDQIAGSDYDRVNHRATMELANAAKAAGVGHFVFISSVSAQSGATADRPLSEDDVPNPSGAYGRSKLAAEEAVRAAGVPFTILRPVMLYGPPRGYLTRLARLASTPIPLPFGAFHNRRSLLGIDNFVSAVLFLLRSPPTGATYLLADPDPVTLPEILAAFRRGLGRRPLIFPFPSGPLRRLMGGSGSELIVRPAKLLAAGWRPAADTPTLLARAIRSPQG